MSTEPIVLDTPDGISYAQLASLKGALKLESKGLKTRGGALRPKWAKIFNLPKNASYDVYIMECERRMNELLAKVQAERAIANAMNRELDEGEPE